MNGVALLGPPTAGKDTVTAALAAADPRFGLLRKLKAGTGRSTGYRLVTTPELDELRSRGRLLTETSRYGNTYAIDRDTLRRMLARGRTPVAHFGSLADLRVLTKSSGTDWLRVLLWVPRDVCARRSCERGDPDTPSRLDAWDALDTELRRRSTKATVDLVLRTDQLPVTDCVTRISAAVAHRPSLSGRR